MSKQINDTTTPKPGTFQMKTKATDKLMSEIQKGWDSVTDESD